MTEKKFDLNLRPAFHITGGNGWINDPNGLIKFRGRYHAFFQYHPHSPAWGPMHWGHVVSDDLTHWERLPVALAPGGEGDVDGCFSGSAIVWRDRLWLIYTGFTESSGGEAARQVQCLASSEDGVNFIKHGVVISSADLPDGYAHCDFRDPKIWEKYGEFWCVVAARKYGGRGRVLLYRSDDLFEWSFVGDILGEDSKGIMTECPEYRDDPGLLTVCEQYQPPEDKVHLNVHTSRWYAGTLDYSTCKFSYSNCGIIDYGFDFYAPQCYLDEPIMLGWLGMWERNFPSEKYGFAGMLTVPRKLEIRDGSLWQTPIVAAKEVYRKPVEGNFSDNIKIGVLKFQIKNLKNFNLLLRKKGENQTKLSLGNGEWIFDRSRSGEVIEGTERDADSVAGIRRMPFAGGGNTEIIIVMDEFSVEIFADGKALSSTVYPDSDADGLSLEISADECILTRLSV